MFIDDVDKHSSDVKSTEDSKDQFVEMAKVTTCESVQ